MTSVTVSKGVETTDVKLSTTIAEWLVLLTTIQRGLGSLPDGSAEVTEYVNIYHCHFIIGLCCKYASVCCGVVLISYTIN